MHKNTANKKVYARSREHTTTNLFPTSFLRYHYSTITLIDRNTQEAIELMQKALKLAQEVGNPPLLWQIHYSLGLLLQKQGNLQKANEHYTEAVALIEETASKLKDPSLKSILLKASNTKAIHDAYARTKSTP